MLQQLCTRLSNKEHIIRRPTWLSGAREEKKDTVSNTAERLSPY